MYVVIYIFIHKIPFRPSPTLCWALAPPVRLGGRSALRVGAGTAVDLCCLRRA